MVTVHRIRDTKAQAPLVSWIPVTGPDGRVQMEMRWQVAEPDHLPQAARSAA